MLSTHRLGGRKKSKDALKRKRKSEAVSSSMLVHSVTGQKAEDGLARVEIANDPMFRRIDNEGVDILFDFEITGYNQCEPFDTLWSSVPRSKE